MPATGRCGQVVVANVVKRDRASKSGSKHMQTCLTLHFTNFDEHTSNVPQLPLLISVLILFHLVRHALFPLICTINTSRTTGAKT